MKNKKIIIGAIGFIILVMIVSIGRLLSKNTVSPGINILPTPTPINVPNQRIIIEDEKLKKAVNLLEQRQPLSDSDTTAKQNVIALQPPNADGVYSTDTYEVIYIRDLDEFQVEIFSTDIQKAKSDAVSWFISQGFTQDGICKLPLTFFLSRAVKNQLTPGTVFNPLPEGC